MKHAKCIRCAAALLLTLGIVLSLGISVAAETKAPILSHGVAVLAAEMDMAVWAPIGNEVVFTQDAFARALNLSRVQYITVHSLPADTDGELLLGSTRVAVGETIAGGNLGHLAFVPVNETVTRASFTFSANGSGVPLVCNVHLLETPNQTPTVSMASSLSLNVNSYRDLACYGNLSAYDPNGDDLTFEIVSYPQNGALILSDRAQGTYVYLPQTGYVGADRFSYVARDRYGNYSAAATVSLNVKAPAGDVDYVDMIDSSAYVAALALTEAGVMSGTQVGNASYFFPERNVSRVEFLVMAMNAVGITDVPACAATSFFDDADIAPSMKGYVAAAYAMGYINGTNVQGELCFLPNEEITRAQAAVMLSNLVGLAEVPVTPTFADGSEIPAWASEAIYSLNATGILDAEEGYISPLSKVTRAQTAQMLANAMEYVK